MSSDAALLAQRKEQLSRAQSAYYHIQRELDRVGAGLLFIGAADPTREIGEVSGFLLEMYWELRVQLHTARWEVQRLQQVLVVGRSTDGYR